MTTKTSAPCAHHWIIATPAGRTSGGYCQKCGVMKEFRNSLDDFATDDRAFAGQQRRYGSERSLLR